MKLYNEEIDRTMMVGVDFFKGNEDVTIHLHMEINAPNTVVIRDNSMDFECRYQMDFDTLFGFKPSEIFWYEIIQEWAQAWYQRFTQPIEEWENEGGYCEQGTPPRPRKRYFQQRSC